MLSLLLSGSILQIAHSSCVPPLTLVRDGQCRGKAGYDQPYFNGPATEMAISKCKTLQAYPVSIHTDEQSSYWIAQRNQSTKVFVLGLTCNATSQQWQWADGSDVDYKPPSGSYDIELDQQCVTGCTWMLNFDGSWTHKCTHTYAYCDFFCISQLELPPSASSDCGNFDYGLDSDCLEIAPKPETWKEAQLICASFGATVASIHNAQENSFVRRVAVSKFAVNGVFLGATLSGKATWIDGSPWDYDNFYPGFPMDGLGLCLALDTNTVSGQWMNVDCASSQLAVACSRKPSTADPTCDSAVRQEGEIIMSPGFPNTASTPCDLFLKVDAGKQVELEIILLEANSCCDRLIITEGNLGGVLIANLTGEASGVTYTTASSNFMRVSWQPNGGVNVRGVMATFRAV